MTRRMWTTGITAASALGFATLVASLLAGARAPVLQATSTFATVVLALLAVHMVEQFVALADDAQVSRATLNQYDKGGSRG